MHFSAARTSLRPLHTPSLHPTVFRVCTSLRSAVKPRRFSSNMEASATPSGAPPAPAQEDPIVQYVVLRSDLWTATKWPLGSVAAQACHASTAVLWLHREDPITQAYCADLDHMRKVVLEVKDQSALTSLSDTLTEAGILHKLWVEQPEDVPTSLATKPYPKSVIGPHLKKLQLCRTPVGK